MGSCLHNGDSCLNVSSRNKNTNIRTDSYNWGSYENVYNLFLLNYLYLPQCNPRYRLNPSQLITTTVQLSIYYIVIQVLVSFIVKQYALLSNYLDAKLLITKFNHFFLAQMLAGLKISPVICS